MWRSGGQLLQAEGTVSAMTLRQECVRHERREQRGQYGWNRAKGTGIVADLLRKATGARPCRALQTIVVTLALTLCGMTGHLKASNRRVISVSF